MSEDVVFASAVLAVVIAPPAKATEIFVFAVALPAAS